MPPARWGALALEDAMRYSQGGQKCRGEAGDGRALHGAEDPGVEKAGVVPRGQRRASAVHRIYRKRSSPPLVRERGFAEAA